MSQWSIHIYSIVGNNVTDAPNGPVRLLFSYGTRKPSLARLLDESHSGLDNGKPIDLRWGSGTIRSKECQKQKSKNLEMRGIEPRTCSMLRSRHTTRPHPHWCRQLLVQTFILSLQVSRYSQKLMFPDPVRTSCRATRKCGWYGRVSTIQPRFRFYPFYLAQSWKPFEIQIPTLDLLDVKNTRCFPAIQTPIPNMHQHISPDQYQ